MSQPLIQVEDLCVERGGRPVLQVAALAVQGGETLALIGPNGAGKSTLLRVLALLQSARMTYRLDGAPVHLPADGLRLRRQMGVVFQEPLLLNATVAANVALGLRLRGVPRARTQPAVHSWLERLGVAHLAGRRAHTLSGGEAQRVALARALVLQPRLLFLDEPFASLDVVTRQPLLQDLRGLLRDEGVTTVFATHDFQEALLLADRVGVLDAGRLVQVDAARQVYLRPATDTVRQLVEATRCLAAALPQDG